MGKDDISNRAAVIGVSSMVKSEGLISSDKFAAIEVKNWLN
jgi:hypothetical protein